MGSEAKTRKRARAKPAARGKRKQPCKHEHWHIGVGYEVYCTDCGKVLT